MKLVAAFFSICLASMMMLAQAPTAAQLEIEWMRVQSDNGEFFTKVPKKNKDFFD